jgi:hypothetical protein
MAKKEDNRDIFDKALDEQDSFRSRREQKKLERALKDEEFNSGMRTLAGGALGALAYGAGRGAIRRFKPKFDEGMRILPPVAMTTAGGIIGAATGDYPASEAKRNRKRRK